MRASVEFRLACDCCRWCFSSPSEREAPELGDVSWDRLVALSRFHRVQGLVWHCLKGIAAAIPNEAAEALSGDAAAIAGSSLRTAAECLQLRADFEDAGIPLLFLKGLTLSSLAYGNASLKSAVDIDLLIDGADLAGASGRLRACGYRLIVPDNRTGTAGMERWHRLSKESVWSRGSPPLQLDLHTRTADNPRLIPEINVRSPRQTVHVGSGISLPTLADEELFAYLAVHGASSAWFRLKWIADFAGFVHRRRSDELAELYRESQRLGAGRAAGQALLLADALFQTLRSASGLRRDLLRDRSTRRLFEAALRFLTSEAGEPTEQRFGTSVIHWTQFLLLPGPTYKLSELSRQLGILAGRVS